QIEQLQCQVERRGTRVAHQPQLLTVELVDLALHLGVVLADFHRVRSTAEYLQTCLVFTLVVDTAGIDDSAHFSPSMRVRRLGGLRGFSGWSNRRPPEVRCR